MGTAATIDNLKVRAGLRATDFKNAIGALESKGLVSVEASGKAVSCSPPEVDADMLLPDPEDEASQTATAMRR